MPPAICVSHEHFYLTPETRTLKPQIALNLNNLEEIEMDPNMPFPLIKTRGTPYGRGEQYGLQCREMIDRVIDFYRWIFEIKSNLSWDHSLDKAAEFMPVLNEYESDIMEEIEGIAHGANRPVEEIVALNVRTELLFLLAAGAGTAKASCTSVAALPPAADHSLLAQNWDWYPQVRDCCVILDEKPQGRPNVLQVVEAGIIAKTGFNSAGIGLCTNALVTRNWRIGVPYHAILWCILNSASMAEAIGAVTSPSRASAANYLIGHADGEAVNLEAAPDALNVIFPDKGIISHANHCKVNNADITDLTPALWPDTIMREHRAGKILRQCRGHIDISSIQQVLRDHFDKPNSICTHPNDHSPPYEQGQTNVSLIMDLTAKKFLVAKGPPCEHEYVDLIESMTNN
jgi:isopenicillin-N N-acyltransferase-like protein